MQFMRGNIHGHAKLDAFNNYVDRWADQAAARAELAASSNPNRYKQHTVASLAKIQRREEPEGVPNSRRAPAAAAASVHLAHPAVPLAHPAVPLHRAAAPAAADVPGFRRQTLSSFAKRRL